VYAFNAIFGIHPGHLAVHANCYSISIGSWLSQKRRM
jgi:hypothetical protein